MSAVVAGVWNRAALVGALLAILTVAFVALLPQPVHGLQFLAVLLGFIAGAYLGFAVADGTARALVIEAAGIAVFVSLAAASLWFASPVLLAAGYIAHGGWDIAHHPRVINTHGRGLVPAVLPRLRHARGGIRGGVARITPLRHRAVGRWSGDALATGC